MPLPIRAFGLGTRGLRLSHKSRPRLAGPRLVVMFDHRYDSKHMFVAPHLPPPPSHHSAKTHACTQGARTHMNDKEEFLLTPMGRRGIYYLLMTDNLISIGTVYIVFGRIVRIVLGSPNSRFHGKPCAIPKQMEKQRRIGGLIFSDFGGLRMN